MTPPLPLFAEISRAQEQILLPIILRLSRVPEQCRISATAWPGAGFDPAFLEVYEKCRDYTLTPIDAMRTMYEAAVYVAKEQIPGDVVECGVWKGGSAMIVALALLQSGLNDRQFYLYDTFEGMPKTETRDENVGNGPFQMAMQLTAMLRGGHSGIFYAPLEEVQSNMRRTGYPPTKLTFVKGLVEDTLPGRLPGQVSLLHLDSDLYSSTYHELTHLFPRLSTGGVLIIDDYETWKGSREATDQYFDENRISMLLNRVGDSGARIGIKPAQAQQSQQS